MSYLQAPLQRCRRPVRLALALVAVLAGAATAEKAIAADTSESLVVGGIARSYRLHVPADHGTGVMPLVLMFHDRGGAGQGMGNFTGFDGLSDRMGFIAAYPDGLHRRWNDGRAAAEVKSDDVGFVATLIDSLARRFPIDRQRIYAAGIANGGMFSLRLACELGGRIAGVAVVAASMPADMDAGCRPARPVSLIEISGTADPIVPYLGGALQNSAGQGDAGDVLSAEETAASWRVRDKCGRAEAVAAVAPIAKPDGTTVARTEYPGCDGNAAVILYSVEGGGHSWPGGPQYAPRFVIGPVSHQLDAGRTIIDFFLAHPRAEDRGAQLRAG
jgi:polyhydroxybutyrate depolymerase